MSDFFQMIIKNTQPWFFDHGIKILAIVLVGLVFLKISKVFVDKLVKKIVTADKHISYEAEKKREDTLIRIFFVSLDVVIWLLMGLMILQEFGFAVGPLIAAAGIAGLAFGFGGQYLIRDLINGLFIILENQYRIGDVVCFGEDCGLVEDISLRVTILRDMDGVVHHIPHGEIKKVSNLSKVFARVNLDIGVAYDTDIEKLISVVNRVGQELLRDPMWSETIIKAPEFLRIEKFADSAIIIKIVGETKPLKQWDVTGELRKRIKVAFDKENIEFPFPQMVVHKAEK